MDKNFGLKIIPYDVCYFRGSKPFSRGSEHFAESAFPPNPSTLYNALRTTIINENNINIRDFYNSNIPDNIKEEIGTANTNGDLSIKGIFLFKGETYSIMPFDIVNNLDQDYRILRLHKDENVIISDKLPYFPFIADTSYKYSGQYFSIENLKSYLYCENSFTQSEIKAESDFILRDKRVGIGIDKNASIAGEGLLFIAHAIEFSPGSCLYAIIEKSSLLKNEGLMRLGGGSRPFIYKKESDITSFEDIDTDKIKRIISKTKRFKVIFLSPSISKEGWKNTEITDWTTKNNIEMISALIQRPKKIGGYNMAENKPKPMYNMLQAGSVYYFDIKNEISDNLLDSIFDYFHLNNHTDINKNQGFGLTVIGGYNEK